ncbi:MAG: sodium-dependent transporter [Victivallaceae bacterium]|nr:sodium-dependent transporter [Victivallaceae bacterium]
MSENSGERTLWGSRIGFLFAAIGSAVGLGNIWRFSNMAYENGGGAFMVPYFVALLVAGIPIMLVEYALGHKFQGSSPLAFFKANKKMEFIGWWMPVVATCGIMLFYSVVIGWCINYFIYSLDLSWGSNTSEFFFNTFLQWPADKSQWFVLQSINWKILASTFAAWFICWAICYKEINHGIEKACLFFMPLLLVLTIILVGWTVTLDGAAEGIRHYITPNWDKINVFTNSGAWKVWTAAFGQIFFTLSLGFGIMITYASYLPKKTNLTGNALFICVANCAYSVFAGFAVFGILGFMAQSQGVPLQEVVKGGPSLCFVVYPEAINQLPVARTTFGALFFLTLIVAGISSGISLIEAFACSIIDKFNIKRGKVITILCLGGFLGSVIFTTNIGMFVLDITDHFINNYGLLIGGMAECILVGWLLNTKLVRKHVNETGGIVKLPPLWDWLIKIATPVLLLTMVIMALIEDIRKPYEGYPLWMIFSFGIGMIVFTLLLSILFATAKWPKHIHDHKPEDEHLLI